MALFTVNGMTVFMVSLEVDEGGKWGVWVSNDVVFVIDCVRGYNFQR